MNKLVNKIILSSEKYDVYAVGGFVRDLLANRKPADIDLAVSKNAQKYAKDLAKSLNAKLVVLDDNNKIYRLILKGKQGVDNIDISLFDGKTIEQDLAKRDFTVNAMAFCIKDFADFKNNLVFVSGAVNDIKSKTVNIVSGSVFKDDPLRMLRAFRLVSEAGYKISSKTLNQIKKDSKLILKSAPERIKTEFFKILSSRGSASILKQMDKVKLLEEMFVEIKNMKKASKKHYYHPGGLFQHSFETMEAEENILNSLKKYFPENCKELEDHFFTEGEFSEKLTRANLLKFTALFHDSAKPETAKKDGKKMRFLGHEEEGAKRVAKIMKNLKMGKKDIAYVTFLIKNHMRPSTLTKNNLVTDKAALKFFRDIKENTPDLLVLAMADWHSYKSLKIFVPSELKQQEKSVKKLIKKYYEIKNEKPLPKLIDGNVIMKKFKLKPGPWVGKLMEIVKAAQEEGEIKDTKEAIMLISSKLSKIKKEYNL